MFVVGGLMSEIMLGKNERILNRLDPHDKLILYGANALGKDLKTEVKMQKLLFLTMNAISDEAFKEMDFIPHKKGPYSQLIEQKMKELSDNGLISLPNCHVSELGKEISNESSPKKPLRDIVDDFKEFVCMLKEDELLAFIYLTFPGYKFDSEEWERISKNMPSIAASMLKKGAVSYSKALEMSGMSEYDFSEYLKKQGVRWRVV